MDYHGNCIHLHLPVDLRKSISENGFSKTRALVNLNLLDAIDRINKLRNDGFYKFQDKNSIYMISPIIVGNVIKFLDSLDFTTHSYSKQNLSDDNFIAKNPEAKLAVARFGKDKEIKNIGTASITFDTINSQEWQEKKNQMLESLKSKALVMLEKRYR